MTEKMTTEEFRQEMQRRRAEKLGLGGQTFRVRDKIKEAGGIWDSVLKLWLMPDLETIFSLGGKPVGNYFEIMRKEKTNDAPGPSNKPESEHGTN